MAVLNKVRHFWNNPNTRTRKINRNIVYSICLKGLGILVSLLMVPLTLSYLDSYEYGIWITLNSVLTWINVLDIGLGNGLRNKLTEALAVNDLEKGRIYVSTTFALLTAISLSLCIFGLILNRFLDWNVLLNIQEPVSNLNTIVNVVLICLCVNFTVKTIGLVYLSYQETFVNGLLTFLGMLLSLVWIFILTKVSEPSLMNVALAFSLSPIIVYLIAYPYTFYCRYREIKPSIAKIRLEYVKSLGGLGVKFFILQISCLVLFFTSNLLISNLFSPAEVTPYSIAFKYFNVVSSVFMIIVNPLWSAITDAYVKRDVAWIESSMNRMMKIFVMACLLMLVMVALSKTVYHFWVGDEVEIPYALSLSLAVFNITYIWANLYSAYCNGVGHLRMALWSMCTAALLFIPVCITIARLIGVQGVAYSLGLVLLIPGLALFYQYIRDLRILKNESSDK